MHRPKFLNGALIVLGLALLQGSATAVSPQWARGLDRAALTQNRAVPFQGLSGGPIVPVVGDELLLRVDSSVARDRIAELLDEYGLRPKRFFGAEGWVHVDLPAIETIRSAAHVRFGESSEDLSGLADAIRLIRSDLRFADVAPNALFRASRKPMGFGDPDSSDTVTPVGDDPDSNNFVPIDDDDDFDDDDPPDSPSDPLRSTQWNLDLLFSTGFTGTPWATAARVAILDSGIAYDYGDQCARPKC